MASQTEVIVTTGRVFGHYPWGPAEEVGVFVVRNRWIARCVAALLSALQETRGGRGIWIVRPIATPQAATPTGGTSPPCHDATAPS